MTIDIVSYTEDQFALLNDEQMVLVKKAQIQKDKLKARHTETLQKYKKKRDV